MATPTGLLVHDQVSHEQVLRVLVRGMSSGSFVVGNGMGDRACVVLHGITDNIPRFSEWTKRTRVPAARGAFSLDILPMIRNIKEVS